MNDRTRNGLMLVAGGYLVYLGIKLIPGGIAEISDKGIYFLIAGIVFVIVGAFTAIINIKRMFFAPQESEETAEESTESLTDADTQEDEAETESENEE